MTSQMWLKSHPLWPTHPTSHYPACLMTGLCLGLCWGAWGAAVLVVKYSEHHLWPLVYSRPDLSLSLVPAWLLSPWTGNLGLVFPLTLRTRPVSAPGQGCML